MNSIRMMNLTSRNLSRSILRRYLCAEGAKATDFKLVYEGKYAKKLRLLKRVSLSSSIISLTLIPVSLYVESGVLPLLAQLAMAGTVFFTSVSSTTILHLVSQPYVLQLYAKPGLPSGARELKATRLGLAGGLRESFFTEGEVAKPSAHPFGSCQVQNHGAMYLHGGAVQDERLRALMSKD